MNVLIRTDASTALGTGHVMRCLAVAEQLRKRNCSVSFYMKESTDQMKYYVQQKSFRVVNSFHPVDLCLIDHYKIDRDWERKIRPFVKRIVVIDDLANRPHECDVLLDQNLVPNFTTRYDKLVPTACKKLLGLRYLILREEFIQERGKVLTRSGRVDRLLIFMGGTDPTNETIKLLRALRHVPTHFSHVDVVVGEGNEKREEIEELCTMYEFHYHCQIDYMAKLIRRADFAIGAGGTAMWERCYLGLPTATVIIAKNQEESVTEADKQGLVWNIGHHEKTCPETYKGVLRKIPGMHQEIKMMSQLSLQWTKSEIPNEWIDYFLEGLS